MVQFGKNYLFKGTKNPVRQPRTGFVMMLN